MDQFRHGGLYKLPDGNAYAVYDFSGGRYYFYPCEFGPTMPPTHTLAPTGEIIHLPSQLPTGWTIEHAEDSGETYSFSDDVTCPD